MISKSEITQKLSSFHTLPAIAQQLLAVLNRSDYGINDLSRVIGLDYALTTNVLRAANSAYFGFTRQVSSLDEAAVRLGSGLISQLAISSVVYANVKRPAIGYGQSAEDLWRHSAAVAVTSANLCNALNVRNSGAIFTAALVHDIGKAVLESWVSEHFAEIDSLVKFEHLAFEQAEERVLGFNHCEVGAMVAEHWHFPDDLIHTIRWHHDPNSAPDGQPGVDIVHIADAVCLMQGIGLGHDGLAHRPCQEALERLRVTTHILEKVTSQLPDSLASIEEVLNVQPASQSVGR